MFLAFILGDMHTTDSGEPSYSPDVSLAISLPMIGVIVVIAVCISIKRCYKKYELRYSEGKIVNNCDIK